MIAATCLLVVVSFPHALEDFHYRDLARFGIDLPVGIAVLATAYAMQLVGVVLVLRGSRDGSLLLAAMGIVWCFGAIIVHGHDMLFAGEQYRHGLISRALELVIIALGVTVAVLGILVAKTQAHRNIEKAPSATAPRDRDEG